MKTELEELGFKLIREYTHGDNNEFTTIQFKKGLLFIDLDYDSKSGKLLHHDLTIEETTITPTLSEINMLDNIFNKK